MQLTRTQRRLREAKTKNVQQKQNGKFEAINLSTAQAVPYWMTRAYRNNKYTVMIDDKCKTSKGNAIKAMIQTHDDMPIKNHWSEIQAIKNEIFGSEVVAVEYYPKESELVNKHNIYWIWIFQDGVLPMPIM